MTTSLITGATAGIGHEYAVQLAARGDDLVLVARNAERLETVAAGLRAAYGVAVEVLAADLVDRDQLALVEARLADRERPIDLLVNNAGFGLKKRFLDNTVEEETEMLEVLVTAVLRLSHAALGPMAERGSGGIINVSSVAAFLPRGSYSAAKAWVNSFSEWAHLEYKSRGVKVMALCPGFTKTEFHERMQVTRGDGFMWLDVDFLVRRSLQDFEKGRAYSIPGAQYRTITVLTKAIPNRVLRLTQSVGRPLSRLGPQLVERAGWPDQPSGCRAAGRSGSSARSGSMGSGLGLGVTGSVVTWLPDGQGPFVGPVRESSVGERPERLGPMVAPAQRRQAIGMGLPGGPPSIDRDVLLDVVEVAYLRRTTDTRDRHRSCRGTGLPRPSAPAGHADRRP